MNEKQSMVVLQQFQGTFFFFFSLLSSVRSLATPRCDTAHRRAWPIALREERCCREFCFSLFLLLLCFLSYEILLFVESRASRIS